MLAGTNKFAEKSARIALFRAGPHGRGGRGPYLPDSRFVIRHSSRERGGGTVQKGAATALSESQLCELWGCRGGRGRAARAIGRRCG
eukprot:2265587-Prymnesium_polylepis.1